QRSGFATATSALERAARLTEQRGRRAALLAQAAEAAWSSGRAEQALRLLDETRATGAAASAVKISCDWLAGRIATNRGPVMRGHAILVAAAELAAGAGAAEDAIAMLADATLACFMACETSELTANARRAEAILPAGASPAARIRAATIVGTERVLVGDAAAGARVLREAVAIADQAPGLLEDAALLPWLAWGPMFLRDESQAGRARLARVLSSARERAAIGALPLMLGLAARDQATTDRWRLSEATYREAIVLARESEQRAWLGLALAGLAWLQARQGREHECRANAAEALGLAETLEARLYALWSLSALGELELALGRPQAALEQFERQRRLADAAAIRDVDLWPAAEMVEAHLRLGRDADARELSAAFQAAAQAKAQPWALARAIRTRALIAPEDEFPELFEMALRHSEQTPDVFESARTQLAFGERLRRARRRVLARVQLRQAEQTFAALGARPWAQRARAELEATGETLRHGEPNTVAELTPQELQIALMLAAGRTTRACAAALFLSPKTIEYHLHHVYLKLGIHSREELARVDGLLQEAATEKTGGSRVAAVPQLEPASPEANTSPEVAPK
ncbi:MAG: helix-turn-helix transcriptional regulator, partial [Acidobacteriota bacterium]|nr:helix-turn-helix transcriptional regulator [Acidobacteriota bacterium]